MSSFFPFGGGGGGSGAGPADDALEPGGDDVDGMFADIAGVSAGLLDDDLEEELTTDPTQSSRSLFNRRGREGSVGSVDSTASSASDDDDGSGSGSGIGAPSVGGGLGTTLWGR